MKYYLTILPVLALLMSAPVYAGPEHDHGHDDHSVIEALDVTYDEALAALDAGLADMLAKVDAGDAKGVEADALNLMSAVKTLEASDINDRQKAALRQMSQQLDNAKHAAQDGELDKAKASGTRASSALKLYKAVK